MLLCVVSRYTHQLITSGYSLKDFDHILTTDTLLRLNSFVQKPDDFRSFHIANCPDSYEGLRVLHRIKLINAMAKRMFEKGIRSPNTGPILTRHSAKNHELQIFQPTTLKIGKTPYTALVAKTVKQKL